jgi:predicted RNA polymerase sigma factor
MAAVSITSAHTLHNAAKAAPAGRLICVKAVAKIVRLFYVSGTASKQRIISADVNRKP